MTALAALVLFSLLHAQQPPAAETSFDLAAEQELFRLANQERTRAGLHAYSSDERLNRAARAHSQEMAKQKQVGQALPGESRLRQRLVQTGLKFSQAAENITLASSAAQAHQLFLGSAAHRENILDSQYDTLGVAVARRGDQLYVTQDFVRRLPDQARVAPGL